MLQSTSAVESHVGNKRTDNEDRYLASDELGVYAVCDGMGGHAAGEIAAQMTVARIEADLAEHQGLLDALSADSGDIAELVSVLANALREACAEVRDDALMTPSRAGMGCTATALVMVGSRAVMAHVGDSRLYLIRDGAGHQLSTDHTMANELALAGVIPWEAVKGHQYAHVLTRAIGSQESVRVDTLVLDVLPGDRYVLCSDGLSDYLTDTQHVAALVGDAEDLEEATDRLIAFALESGGKDNVTVLVVAVDAGDETPEVLAARRTDVSARLEALGGVFLFDELSLRNLTRLMRVCEIQEVGAGEVLVKEREQSVGLLIPLDGRLTLTRGGRAHGEVLVMEDIGVSTLLTPRPSRVTVTAAEPTRVLKLSAEAFLAVTRKRPYLGVRLLERLGRRLTRDLDRANRANDEQEPSDLF